MCASLLMIYQFVNEYKVRIINWEFCLFWLSFEIKMIATYKIIKINKQNGHSKWNDFLNQICIQLFYVCVCVGFFSDISSGH